MNANNKFALITGASGSIGKALCQAFTDNGYYVIATDIIDSDEIICDSFIKADLGALCHSDIELSGFTEKVLRELDGHGLHILVNNAATQILGAVNELSTENWMRTLDVNLTAPFLLAQSFLSLLQKTNGSIINISSVHATATKPNFVAYATSKAALSGLTQSLAIDLAPEVRVNAVNPAATNTPMLLEGFLGKKDKYDELKKMHPLERIAEPEEIADVVVFLASDKAKFITGINMDIDGGILRRLHDPD